MSVWNFFIQIGKVPKALNISKEMESHGIKHNDKTYSMLTNGFACSIFF